MSQAVHALGRRYATIWHASTGAFGNLFQPAKSVGDYQLIFDSLAGSGLGYRPSALAVAIDTTIASVFRSDKIGPWIAQHNLTTDQYQQAFNDAVGQAYIPRAASAAPRATRQFSPCNCRNPRVLLRLAQRCQTTKM